MRRLRSIAFALGLTLALAAPSSALAGRGAKRSRAAIDIGSSGIKLLVVNRKGRVLVDEKIGASLGKAIGPDRLVPKGNQERARAALEILVDRARAEGVKPGRIEVIATAAVRNADGKIDRAARKDGKVTGRAFIDKTVRSTKGLGLRRARILSDQQEAELGYRGAIRGWKGTKRDRLVMIDTGGGSHQVVAGTGKRIDAAGSTQIGSNFVAENVLVDERGEQLDVASAADLAAADGRIGSFVTGLPIHPSLAQGANLLATGGVSKFLYHHFRSDRVTGDQIRELRERIAAVPSEERGHIMKRDVNGKRLTGREQRILGLHADGRAGGSYGRKLPAKLTLLLHLMKLAGGDSLFLSQTDSRHVLVDD